MIESIDIKERRKHPKPCKYCSKRSYFFDNENNEYLCKNDKTECPDWHMHVNIPNSRCDYCNDAPAIVYFTTARKYCCASNMHKCKAFRKSLSKNALGRMKNSRNAINREKIAAGTAVCKYCGGVANFWRFKDTFCCSSKSTDCPGYHEWRSNQMKEVYKNKPEFIELQREIGKEVHNREEVKEKKRETMTMLHRGDCEPCKEFQKNYAEGRKKWAKAIEKEKK